MQDPASSRRPGALHVVVEEGEGFVERSSRIDVRRRYNPLEDGTLVNALPNLILRPEKREDWETFLASYSILRGESSRFEQLRAALRRSPSQDDFSLRRVFHRFFQDTYGLTDETFERDMKMFDDSIVAAHATISTTVKEYFSVRQQHVLKMNSRVASERDPVRLVRLAATRGRDIMSRITSYEAQRQLALAQMEFELRLSGYGPDALNALNARFIERLCRDYFVPGRSEQMALLATLDPSANGKVTSFRLVPMTDPAALELPSETLANITLDIRFVRAQRANGEWAEIPVYFSDGRVKADVTLKQIRKRQRHPESLSDLLGQKLIFFSEEDRDLGVTRLRETVVCVPGSVYGFASNAAQDKPMNGSNEHSSSEFRAMKYHVRFMNRFVEFMFELAGDYVNEIMSTGDVNHALYKVGAYIDLVFPVIFPTELYRIDWRAADQRERMRQLQIGKI